MKPDDVKTTAIRKCIDELDLSMIANNMVVKQSWRKSEVEECATLYRNFLFLKYKYPDEIIVPSEDVDEFWHNHILDTKKYRNDSQAIFGHFVDHYPYFGMDATSTMEDLQLAFAKTQQLHLREFGYPITRIKYPKILGWVTRLLKSIS